jgi:hypothetical protein
MSNKPNHAMEPRKRLNLDLPESRLVRVQELAKSRGFTSSGLVRAALSLFERVDMELSEGNRIAIIDSKGNLIRELVPLTF